MKYGNIIQMNLIDHYHNLTLKAVGLLNWLNINCPQVLYILKCDDDVYVNVPNFFALLRGIPSKELAIYGSYGNITVDRFDKGTVTYMSFQNKCQVYNKIH